MRPRLPASRAPAVVPAAAREPAEVQRGVDPPPAPLALVALASGRRAGP